METLYQQHKDDGLMVIQALAETDGGTTPTAEELAGWADRYGQTFPVIADEGWAIENRFAQDNGIPSFTLLGPGAEVLAADDFAAEGMIAEALPDDWE